MSAADENVVIITGAVGNLGVATVRAFDSAKYRTVPVDHAGDRLRQVFPHLASSSNHLLVNEINLIDPASVQSLLDRAVVRFGRVDVLVNIVGTWRGGKSVIEDDLVNRDLLLAANLRTTLLCCRGVIPKMLEQGRGKIINVARRHGLSGTARNAACGVAKGAVLRLTEALADELRTSNINVNCIVPSVIDTRQNRAAMPKANFSKRVDPAAFIEVILFLASDAARSIRGALLPVYGKA
jgi:NAD(P)-dependent dehydrogenase (short-subunit alcohol dehydrogenase family)